MKTHTNDSKAEATSPAVTPQAEVMLPGAQTPAVPAPGTSPTAVSVAAETVKAETTSGEAAAEAKKGRQRKKTVAAVPLEPTSTLVSGKVTQQELTSGLQLLQCRGVLRHPETFAYILQFVAKQDESVVFERELEATDEGPDLGSDLHRDLETLSGEELTPRKLKSLTLDRIIGRKALGVVRLGRGRRRPTVDALFSAQEVKELLTAEGLN